MHRGRSSLKYTAWIYLLTGTLLILREAIQEGIKPGQWCLHLNSYCVCSGVLKGRERDKRCLVSFWICLSAQSLVINGVSTSNVASYTHVQTVTVLWGEVGQVWGLVTTGMQRTILEVIPYYIMYSVIGELHRSTIGHPQGGFFGQSWCSQQFCVLDQVCWKGVREGREK